MYYKSVKCQSLSVAILMLAFRKEIKLKELRKFPRKCMKRNETTVLSQTFLPAILQKFSLIDFLVLLLAWWLRVKRKGMSCG